MQEMPQSIRARCVMRAKPEFAGGRMLGQNLP